MTDSPSPGQASNITRAEFAFIDVTTGATHGAAEAFNFLFAGGYISGTVGVYEVYASADNGNLRGHGSALRDRNTSACAAVKRHRST